MKIFIYHLLFLSWTLLNFQSLSAADSTTQLLESNFKAVSIVEGNLTLEMNDLGPKYIHRAAVLEDSRLLNYGEKLILPHGFEKVDLYNKDTYLVLEQIDKNQNKYQLNVKINQHSSGRKPIKIHTEFIISDDRIKNILRNVNIDAKPPSEKPKPLPTVELPPTPLPTPTRPPEAKPLPLTLNEQILSPTLWCIIVVLILVAIGLLWLWTKNRK